MMLEIRHENGIQFVRLEGRFDAIATPEAEAALVSLAQKTLHPVLIDFSGVDYIGSLGLQALARIANILKERDILLRLCGLRPFVAEVFRITHFSRLFHVDATPEAALSALCRNPAEASQP